MRQRKPQWSDRSCPVDGTSEIALLLSSKLRIEIFRIQFEYVIIVIEEIQSPVGTRPYELAPHRLELGGGSSENFRCDAKGNMVPGPDTLSGCAHQHNPSACEPEECFQMPVFVLALNRTGAEEVMKQRSRPGRVLHYEGNVANCFEHASPRQTCCSMIRSKESVHYAAIPWASSRGGC